MAKRTTLYDVAQASGVSIATVSFAFTKPDRVRSETLQRVLAAAEQLGYVPSASARGLASGTTGALGLYAYDYLLDPGPDAADSGSRDGRLFPLYADEVQRGVQLECRARGYALMVGGGRDSDHLPLVVDVAGRVDGLIAFAGAVPPQLLQRLSRRIPVVQLGGETRWKGVHTVLVDSWAAMYAVTEHLLTAHGHRRLVYVGQTGTAEFAARYEGFAAACRDAGVAVPPTSESRPGQDASTAAVVTDYLRGSGTPDAFVCATDQEALATVDTLVTAGLSVPEDAAVTGFDGIIAGRLSRPSLTTAGQPMEDIGRAAVRMLVELVEGNTDADRHEVLHCDLVVGRSCGCTG